LDCISCHNISTSSPMMTMDCKTCHLKEQEVKPLSNCASCHKSLQGLHRENDHSASGCTACHRPHGWNVGDREVCLSCHEDRKDHYPTQICGECHPFTH
jgi:hypothetical protein